MVVEEYKTLTILKIFNQDVKLDQLLSLAVTNEIKHSNEDALEIFPITNAPLKQHKYKERKL